METLLDYVQILVVIAIIVAIWLGGIWYVNGHTKETGVTRWIWLIVSAVAPLIGPLIFHIVHVPAPQPEPKTQPRYDNTAHQATMPPRQEQQSIAPVASPEHTITAQEYIARQRQTAAPTANTGKPIRQTRPPVAKWRLQTLSGQGIIKDNTALHYGDTVVGAEPLADESAIVVQNDASVSGRHVRLTLENGKVQLENISQRPYTWVNEGQVKPGETVGVSADDVIRLGSTEFRLTDGRQPTRTTEVPVRITSADLHSPPRANTTTPPAFTLIVTEGPHTGMRVRVNKLPMQIGRGSDSDVRLRDDDKVSRTHAQLYNKHGKLGIRDIDSTRGTTVNGYEIADRVLSKGDRIRVGISQIVVE